MQGAVSPDVGMKSSPKIIKSHHTSFFKKGDIFDSGPKRHPIFGLFLQENVSPRTLNNHPIRSFWQWVYLFVGMPYNWSFYHPGLIEGEEGGILSFLYSMIYVYGFYILARGLLDNQSRAKYSRAF